RRVESASMADFIGYPTGRLLGVFDLPSHADRAVDALKNVGILDIDRYEGSSDADRFDATGRRHGTVERVLRTVQFSLMDQLPAMAWYEAALREGKTVLAIGTGRRPATLRVVEALKASGGHFVNHFGRAATEEFARWQGPEPNVSSLMKH